MSAKVVAKKDESSDSVVRRFSKLIIKTGLLNDVKKRDHYEKPSEMKKKRLKERKKKIMRQQRLERLN